MRVAVWCRNSPLETVTPSTAANIRPHTPPVTMALRPEYVSSGATPALVPAREDSMAEKMPVSAAAEASRP